MWKEQMGKVILDRSAIRAGLAASSVTLGKSFDLSGHQFHYSVFQHTITECLPCAFRLGINETNRATALMELMVLVRRQ